MSFQLLARCLPGGCLKFFRLDLDNWHQTHFIFEHGSSCFGFFLFNFFSMQTILAFSFLECFQWSIWVELILSSIKARCLRGFGFDDNAFQKHDRLWKSKHKICNVKSVFGQISLFSYIPAFDLKISSPEWRCFKFLIVVWNCSGSTLIIVSKEMLLFSDGSALMKRVRFEVIFEINWREINSGGRTDFGFETLPAFEWSQPFLRISREREALFLLDKRLVMTLTIGF